MRKISLGGAMPLVRPGMAFAVLFLLLSFLQAAGWIGGGASLGAQILTCAGLSLAWGYLLAGATAGGWGARVVGGLVLVVALLPVGGSIIHGFSGIALLAGLVVYLGWRWWSHVEQPALDLVVVGALALLLFGVVADRALLGAMASPGESFFAAVLSAETASLAYFTLPLLVLAGASLGDALGRATGAGASWLERLPAGVLFSLGAAGAAAKLAWDLAQGPAAEGWLAAALAALALGGWYWLAHPRTRAEWPERLPMGALALAAAFVFSNEAVVNLVSGADTRRWLMTTIYVTAVAALVLAVGALLLRRRAFALLAGLSGMWMLVAANDGATQPYVALLAPLTHLPQVNGPATDGLIHVLLLGWSAACWLRGRRDRAPYALLLATVVVLVGATGLNAFLDSPRWQASLGTEALWAGAALYCLWVGARQTPAGGGRPAVAWAGLLAGGALLLTAAGYWLRGATNDPTYGPLGMAYLGFALFSLMLYLWSWLRMAATATAAEGVSSHE